ncbi:MAG: hypothetical protein JJE35_04855 [Thermoleophilia bacterium]|nr:hypothetical protein [Thermoleophilia bacterium]
MEIHQDKRTTWTGTEAAEATPVPLREGRRGGLAPEVSDQLRTLTVKHGGRAANQDGERCRIPKAVAEEILASSRVGAGDGERGWLELVLDADPNDAERGDNRDRGQQGRARTLQSP